MTKSNTTKTNKTAAKRASIQLVQRCNDLIKRRESWEAGAYKTSNEQLYEILASAYELYLHLADASYRAEQKAFRALLKENNVVFQENTPLHTRVVRLVFATNRKRSYTYGRVLLVARTEKVAASDLPNWIRSQDGVEEIKAKSSGKPSPAEKAEANAEYAKETLVGSSSLVSLGKLPSQLKPDPDVNPVYSIALVRCENGVDGEIVWGTANAAILKAALALAGKSLRDTAVTLDIASTQRKAVQKRRNAVAATSAKIRANSAADGIAA